MDRLRHLEFEAGVLAVQSGLISAAQLYQAISEWLPQADSRSLADILLSSYQGDPSNASALAELFSRSVATSAHESEIDLERTSDFDVARFQEKMRELKSLRGSALLHDDSDPTTDIVPGEQMTSSLVFTGARLLGDRFRLLPGAMQGGLGIVHQARDLQLNRIVALKQIKRADISEFEEEKFCTEATITGQLEHPGIVPIYALDVDENHHPFYAMKFIHGHNLRQEISNVHESAQASSLLFNEVRFRQLLRHFVDICNAIGYAHSRKVIHRDLKPENIMLGEHGETLVVDWGLAKVIDKRSLAEANESDADKVPAPLEIADTLYPTMQGAFKGTPAYAAPEQLRGDVENIREPADIYSLGAILFAILTGRAPVIPAERNSLVIAEAIRGGLATPRQIAPAVPRPLEMICLKAMAYEIADRYHSTTELANEVERWMADDRVIAYAKHEPAFERAGRLLRRHRAWTIPSAFALTLVVIAAVIGSFLVNDARLKEKNARLAEQSSKEDALNRYRVAKDTIDTTVKITDFLASFDVVVDAREEILGKAVESYQLLRAQRSNDPELELERIRAAVRLADSLCLQGLNSEGFQVYQDALAELASPDFRRVFDDQQYKVILDIERARTLARFGLAKYNYDNKSDDVLRLYEESVFIYRQHHSTEPNSSWFSGNLAVTLSYLAELKFDSRQLSDANKIATEAVDLFELAIAGDDRRFDEPCIKTGRLLGQILRDLDQLEQSNKCLLRNFSLIQSLATRFPSQTDYSRELAGSKHSLAQQLHRYGDSLQAKLLYQQTIDDCDTRLVDHRESIRLQELRAYASANLASLLLADDNLSESAIHCNNALVGLDALLQKAPRQRDWSRAFALALTTQSQLLMKTDLYSMDTQNNLLVAYQLLEDSQKANDTPDVSILKSHATIKAHLGRYFHAVDNEEEARIAFTAALDEFQLCREKVQFDPELERQIAHTWMNYGHFEVDCANESIARDAYAKAFNGWESICQGKEIPADLHVLARFYLDCPIPEFRQPERATELAFVCHSLIPDNSMYSLTLADGLIRINRLGEAESVLASVWNVATASDARTHLVLARLFKSLGQRFAAKDRLDLAFGWIAVHSPFDLDLERQWQEVALLPVAEK